MTEKQFKRKMIASNLVELILMFACIIWAQCDLENNFPLVLFGIIGVIFLLTGGGQELLKPNKYDEN